MVNKMWIPDQKSIEATRLLQWMKQLGFDDYESFYRASIQDISWFWGEAEKALGIQWFTPYTEVVNLTKGLKWPEWYEGGRLNVVFNAIEKWTKKEDTARRVALRWEGEDGAVKTYTFAQMHEWISKIANGLRTLGIQKGDRISIYLPMIPETVVTMLAAAKIGAIFSPAFSGYAADAVSTRLNAAQAKLLVTADGFMRRGKPVAMKIEADRAAQMSPCVEKVVVVRRLGIDVPWNPAIDIEWSALEAAEPVYDNEPMATTEPLMILYTSGTTGKPKGAVHTHSGFPLKAAFDAGFGMDVKPGDTLFWFTDMGWMMGPFLIFGSLLNGATALLYEGTPDFPRPDRMWKLISKHQVTHLGISPTLIRLIMKYGESWIDQDDIRTLRVIGSTGEPWNPEPWVWLFDKIGKGQIPIFNYSGGTEISGGILGNVLVKPITPITFNAALPAMDIDVFDAQGHPVRDAVGELVIKQPWVGMTQGFWEEPQRYEEAYWSRWKDTWVHGDWVTVDSGGYWTITGRSDDTLNVAGKRVGPAEIESILVGHQAVVEAGAIGIPDEIKGEDIICFVVLHTDVEPTESLKAELLDLVASKMGKALKPKAIHFVSDLPKTRNAKVMRRAIRSAFLDRDPGDLSALENPDSVASIRALTQ